MVTVEIQIRTCREEEGGVCNKRVFITNSLGNRKYVEKMRKV